MAVAVGSTSTLALGASRTTSTVTAPASIANGDLLLAIVVAADAGDIVAPVVTGPAGWTKYSGSAFTSYIVADNFAVGLNVFWKIAASESGSYNFTHSSASSQAIIYRITGADTTAPLSPTITSNTNTGNSPANVGKLATALGLTTTTATSLIIYAVSLWDGGPGTPPTGTTPTFTERLDSGLLYVADGVLASAGATGDKVNATAFTAQTTSSPWYALLIAVKIPSVNAYSVTATAGNYALTGTAVATTYTPVAGAGPTFRAMANTTYGSGHTDTIITKPAGTANGDIMIAGIMAAQSDPAVVVITPPAGWTAIGTPQLVTDGGGFDSRFWVYWKRASSEGASYAFLHEGGSGVASQGVIASYFNCLASGDPVDVFSQNFGTGAPGTTATGTGVTTTVANTKLIWIGNNWTGTPLTPPSGMTERFDGICYLADEDRASSGATSNRTQTQAANEPWQVYMVALKPPAGGATAYSLTAAAGGYTLTGTPVTLTKATPTKVINATAGGYTLTGSTATVLNHGWKLLAEASSYTLTGSNATLSKSGVGGSLPVFRAFANTTYAQRSDTTIVSKPTGTLDNDIMIMTFFAGAGAAGDITLDTPPAGWTQIGTTTLVTQIDNNFNARLWVYWKRAASEGADYTFAHNNTLYTQASIASYSDCIASGSPIDVFSQNSATGAGSSTATALGVTVNANTKLIYTGHNWTASTTLTPPTGLTERLDSLLYYADQDRIAPGATGDMTQTLAETAPWQAYLIALKPVPSALSPYALPPSTRQLSCHFS